MHKKSEEVSLKDEARNNPEKRLPKKENCDNALSHRSQQPDTDLQQSEEGESDRLARPDLESGNRAIGVNVQGLQLALVMTSSHRGLLMKILDLHKEEDRIKSFSNWKCAAVMPKQLAKSGFFYLGNADRCQCFSCSGVLRNWRYGDCVEDEHGRQFAHCKMVSGEDLTNIPMDTESSLAESASASSQENLPSEMKIRRKINQEKEVSPLSTYLKFPAIALVDVIALAKHGFYWIGYKDCVQCFSCGAFMQNWCATDNPRLAKWHLPGCQLVLGSETSNEPIGDYTPEFIGTFTSSLCRVNDPFVPSCSTSFTSPSAEALRKLFPSYPIRSLGVDARANARGNALLQSCPPSQAQCPIVTENASFTNELNGDSMIVVNQSSCGSSGNAYSVQDSMHGTSIAMGSDKEAAVDKEERDDDEWKRKLEELEDERKCKNCFTSPANSVVIPCGHLSLCDVCSPSAKKCGVCRSKIASCVKVPMP